MHDPLSRICQIRIPIPFMGKSRAEYRGGYIELAEIWHKDPCKDGTDDSCGRFKRARHGDPEVLDKAVKRLSHDWDSTFQSGRDSDFGSDANGGKRKLGEVRFTGMFHPDGKPIMSTLGIVLNIYFVVLLEHFSGSHDRQRDKAMKWMTQHFAEIAIFAENPVDSLHQSITCVFGEHLDPSAHNYKYERESRIRRLVSAVYGDVLRKTQPWWKSPSFHIHHWRITIPMLRKLKRLLWDRCAECGGSLGWNKSVVSNWEGTRFTCWKCDGPCESKVQTEAVCQKN